MDLRRMLRIAGKAYRVATVVVDHAERIARAVEQPPPVSLPPPVPTAQAHRQKEHRPRAKQQAPRVLVPDAIFDEDGNQIFPTKGRRDP